MKVIYQFSSKCYFLTYQTLSRHLNVTLSCHFKFLVLYFGLNCYILLKNKNKPPIHQLNQCWCVRLKLAAQYVRLSILNMSGRSLGPYNQSLVHRIKMSPISMIVNNRKYILVCASSSWHKAAETLIISSVIRALGPSSVPIFGLLPQFLTQHT